MINIKKSSKRKIFLSIIAAFILFSMAATYAFAANVNEPNAELPDTVNDAIKIAGVIGLGYAGDNGEITTRISYDGGVTWCYPSKEHGKDEFICDPDLSSSKWVTYDEFKTWIDMQDKPDEKIVEYESMREDLKNGVIDYIGIITIKGNELVFSLVTQDDNNIYQADYLVAYNEVAIGDRQIAIYDNGASIIIINDVEALERIEEQIAEYDFVFVSDYMDNSGSHIKIYNGEHIANQIQITQYEYFTVVGDDKLSICASTYKELCEIVRNYFEEKIQEGKMTKEEADNKLSEITEENTVKVVLLDSEYNIIN